MLARKLNLALDGVDILSTPILVPSISSRTNIDITKLMDFVSEKITGSALISAYDLYHIFINKNQSLKNISSLSKADLIFIDSGGYECAKSKEVSEYGFYWPDPKEWNKALYLSTIESLDAMPPKAIVSYDHPTIREPFEYQLRNAKELFNQKAEIIKEFLIKPEQKNSPKIDLIETIKNIERFKEHLKRFDIIGFTEKELGNSILDRMTSIAMIRQHMDKEGVLVPIHIFGSLDPIITPLYYLSGADIFDGLAWIRFIFMRGMAFQYEGFGPFHDGIDRNIEEIWMKSISDNYSYIRKLNLNLKSFLNTEDYGLLGPNPDFFKDSYGKLLNVVGGKK